MNPAVERIMKRCKQVFVAAERSGQIKPKTSCEWCGASFFFTCSKTGRTSLWREYIHAHHANYFKPLDVIWLCPKCHIGHHNKLRKEKAARDGTPYLTTSTKPQTIGELVHATS